MSNGIIELAESLGYSGVVDSPTGAHPETWARLSLNNRNTPHKTIDNIAIVLETDPAYASICFDVHASRMLYNGARIDDNTITRMRREIGVRYQINASRDMIDDCVKMVAHDNIIEPIKDYLTGLVWDSVPRINTILTDAFCAEVVAGAGALVSEMGRCWFLSAVARIMQAGCKADTCLILVGGKGLGKSTSMRYLAGDLWFSDSDIDIGGKNGYELLHQTGAWIWEIAEMHALQGRTSATAKQFLTSASDIYRPAYARHPVQRDRRTVFVATTNDYQFLSDGAERRFFPINITTHIKTEWLKENRDQIWAEVVAMYNNGDQWWLDRDMESQLARYQQSYIIDDPWALKVMECIDNAAHYITTQDVMKYIELPASQQHVGNSKRIAQICRDYGFEQKSSKGRRFWVRR